MSNIELYLDKMKELLNSDILRKILTYINIDIIKKQKLLKYELNKEIKEYNNIYFNNLDYIVYRNMKNNLIIKNKRNKNTKYKLIKTKNNNIDDLNNINDLSNLVNSNLIISNEQLIDENILLNTSNNIKIIVKYI
tara:strand:+ start:15260 stop:15667 length:408 start_codon:yes stop_codon:yes gene_type:complete